MVSLICHLLDHMRTTESFCRPFEAEITAMVEYACENLKRGIQDMKIGIFTHNHAGLKALPSSEPRSRTI
ncbi:hypothetical protein J6590_094994 [Homalodisca vitripennis]|nr:hypothetical protein J6590_094994 [Homalodisca vitripennis]